jgi:hypothetical protein
MTPGRFSASYQKYNIIFLACQAQHLLADANFQAQSEHQTPKASGKNRQKTPQLLPNWALLPENATPVNSPPLSGKKYFGGRSYRLLFRTILTNSANCHALLRRRHDHPMGDTPATILYHITDVLL